VTGPCQVARASEGILLDPVAAGACPAQLRVKYNTVFDSTLILKRGLEPSSILVETGTRARGFGLLRAVHSSGGSASDGSFIITYELSSGIWSTAIDVGASVYSGRGVVRLYASDGEFLGIFEPVPQNCAGRRTVLLWQVRFRVWRRKKERRRRRQQPTTQLASSG
jgi:hypothetical protein